MIRIDIRQKAFGETEVLRDVRLEVDPGERVAVLGPSGVGKTTLLRIVAGIDRDFEGEVERPDETAIVFQEPTLLRWRSAVRNLTLTNSGVSEEEGRAMLARVGLAGRAGDFPGQLSLGQQRRVALARAFIGRPRLLILDEPFASLDSGTADEMMTLTEGLIRDTHPAVLLVTHVEAEAERLGDRIVRLAGAPATLA